MGQYHWRWVMYGMWAMDSFVYYHPNNRGLIDISMQGQESKIGMMKKNASVHGNGQQINLIQTANQIDCLTLGTVKNDAVDWRPLSNAYQNKRVLIYNPENTEQVLFGLEQQLPSDCHEWLHKFKNTKYNDVDTIDEEIFNVYYSDKALAKKCDLLSKEVNDQILFEIIDEDIEKENHRKFHNKSRKSPRKNKSLKSKINNIQELTNQEWYDNEFDSACLKTD